MFLRLQYCSLILTLCIIKGHLNFNISFNNYDDNVGWPRLIKQAVRVYTIIDTHPINTKLRRTPDPRISLVLFQDRTILQRVILEQELFRQVENLILITCKLPGNLSNDILASKLLEVSSSWHIEVALVLSETSEFVSEILKTLAKETLFKWTSLKHTTEWIVISLSETLTDNLKKESNKGVDFMTLIYMSESGHIKVAQKSRKEKFHNVIVIPPGDKFCIDFCVSKYKDMKRIDYLAKFRKSALHFLKDQKSVLDGLVLPVAVLKETEDKVFTYSRQRNVTEYDGYSMVLLDTLAESMGFCYTVVTVEDEGYYGDVLDNGDVIGITGLLARREAALTTLPFSITESRRTKVDYVYTPIIVENVNIIYRLPSEKDQLDLTYLDVVQVEFFLYLIGPMIAVGIIGAAIHVLTNSCYNPGPEEFKKDNLSLLSSFPEHICFHSDRSYKVQSGLILRTSWALFWFILSSAYSAYLVTSYTVKPPELVISTFQQLLDHKEYALGMTKMDTALISYLKSSKDEVLSQIWLRLVQQNKTDPATFNPNISFHCKRVLGGYYAYIIQTPLDLMPVEDYPDVRTYPQKHFTSIREVYIGTPKNTFYQQDFSRVMHSLEESGILQNLKAQSFNSRTRAPASSKVNSNKSVSLSRILLSVYCALCGVGLSIVSLVFEIGV
ncbi:glutamate receptor ionotropic, kainate 3 [Biomphalaria glabrata]|nr:glutamate receptor ionotropic, kainate 3 [Biomphalaria glabrata]